MKKALDKGLYTGILLTDLSKAFDSLSHELLIAKLNAYGFSNDALNPINDYLTVIQNGRQVRAKKNINNYFRKQCNFSVTVYMDFVDNRSLETDARVFL